MKLRINNILKTTAKPQPSLHTTSNLKEESKCRTKIICAMNHPASCTYCNGNTATAQQHPVTLQCPTDMFFYCIISTLGGCPITQNWFILARCLAYSNIFFPAVNSNHLQDNIWACSQAYCNWFMSQHQWQIHIAVSGGSTDSGSAPQYQNVWKHWTFWTLHGDSSLALPTMSVLFP